ncbi:hypothetical protein [Cohaesibacter sp. CAU 1516]|uniref:hypothetical protein n=1 Tax=Cohaesibacter sp. CAU 1516 TaxID=2576038 RepID=UPI001485B0C7|nr:hypothetical protein [Cohaesibacter sp. CAU 1516]
MSDQQAEKEQQYLAMRQEHADFQSMSKLLETAKEIGFSDDEIKNLRAMYGSFLEKGNA